MVNGLHLYSAFIQSAVQFTLIHPFTHTFTHQRRLAAMQGTNQCSNAPNPSLAQGHFVTPRVGSNRQPATLRLPDDSPYLLSHIAPQ